MSPQREKKSDIARARAEVESLRSEARSFGVYVTDDSLSVLRETVGKIREARADKPPCYWRAYDRLARECRICDVQNDCARGDDVPDHVPTQDLRPVTCEMCGESLSIEIEDKASGRVLDYGCENPECDGVLGDQARHVPPEPQKIEVRPPGPAAGLETRIAALLERQPGIRLPEAVKALPANLSGKLKRDTIRSMIKAGLVEQERVGGVTHLFLAGKD